MPLYLVLRAHRGKFGYVRAGEHLTLPDGYAKELMRLHNPLVRPMTEAELAAAKPGVLDGAASSTPAGEGAGAAAGESQAGAATADPPAAGSGSPLSSAHLARRSRRRTSKPAGDAPGS